MENVKITLSSNSGSFDRDLFKDTIDMLVDLNVLHDECRSTVNLDHLSEYHRYDNGLDLYDKCELILDYEIELSAKINEIIDNEYFMPRDMMNMDPSEALSIVLGIMKNDNIRLKFRQIVRKEISLTISTDDPSSINIINRIKMKTKLLNI